jgi:hypothetical protein
VFMPHIVVAAAMRIGHLSDVCRGAVRQRGPGTPPWAAEAVRPMVTWSR